MLKKVLFFLKVGEYAGYIINYLSDIKGSSKSLLNRGSHKDNFLTGSLLNVLKNGNCSAIMLIMNSLQ